MSASDTFRKLDTIDDSLHAFNFGYYIAIFAIIFHAKEDNSEICILSRNKEEQLQSEGIWQITEKPLPGSRENFWA